MRFFTYLILLAVVGTAVVGLPEFRWVGAFSSFVGFQRVTGKDQVVQVYKTCVEKTNSGVIESTRAECVGHLVSYLFEAVFSVIAGGYAVGAVESGFGNSQETTVPPPEETNTSPPRTRGDQLDLSFLDAINIHLTNLSMSENRLFATDAVVSDIPSFEGVAIRFNVHGDDTTLHVHTNGTHAIATFDDGIHLGRRDFLPTDNHYYEFNGVNGLKMQAHAINTPSTSDYHDDLDAFADHFARSNMQPRPIFQGSDSWDLQVCNRDKTATFFYGRLVVEMNRPGIDFESMDPPGC